MDESERRAVVEVIELRIGVLSLSDDDIVLVQIAGVDDPEIMADLQRAIDFWRNDCDVKPVFKAVGSSFKFTVVSKDAVTADE